MNDAAAWSPMEPLTPEFAVYVDAQMDALMSEWGEEVKELQKKEHYKAYLGRVRRQWAIETGVLERLYTLDEGVTKTLIEQGLDAAYISHDSSDQPAAHVIALISDQYNALEALSDFLNGQRPFGISFIKELHQLLTVHQDDYDAVDSLGSEVRRKLNKGAWKSHPNHVGTVVCCPPEHVESEMLRLVELFKKYDSEGVRPYVLAAWLHHRFSQIHPFEDGNGRVSRCLATLVFLKYNWHPLVITRLDRVLYIEALKSADNGNLRPLTDLFIKLQKLSIRRALSLSELVEKEESRRATLLEALGSKFTKISQQAKVLESQALVVADTLFAQLDKRVREYKQTVEDIAKKSGAKVKVIATSKDRRSPEAHWNRHQIINCARKQDYYADLAYYKAWSSLSLIAGSRIEILFSIHGMGRDSGRIFACSAMTFERPDDFTGDSAGIDVSPIVDEPFVFTQGDNPTDVAANFDAWISDAFLSGLKAFIDG